MKCSECQSDAPIQRIKMGEHRFCSAACVVKYAGNANNYIPWRNSEVYQMYYEMDFDEKIKGTLSEQDETVEPKDTGHQAVPSTVQASGLSTQNAGAGGPEQLGTIQQGTLVRGSEGSQGYNRENICLCRSGVLDEYKSPATIQHPVDGQQKTSRSNCSNKGCACFPDVSGKDGNKDS